MKPLAFVAGIALLAFGLLFAGQGAGIIRWPADSFMLANRAWVLYGLVIAAGGATLIWWSRGRRR